jgi:DNA-binding IclR family transcriptional regulator
VIRTNPQADLLALLREAKRPMNLDEISRTLALPLRWVAYMLVEANRRGGIEKRADGRYAVSSSARRIAFTKSARREHLDELFLFVLACEANWRLDDRLSYLDRSSSRL